MSKKRADIVIVAPDDATHLFGVELTAAEMAVLERVADMTVAEASWVGPKLRVSPTPPEAPPDECCQTCFGLVGDRPYVRDRYGYRHVTCEEES